MATAITSFFTNPFAAFTSTGTYSSSYSSTSSSAYAPSDVSSSAVDSDTSPPSTPTRAPAMYTRLKPVTAPRAVTGAVSTQLDTQPRPTLISHRPLTEEALALHHHHHHCDGAGADRRDSLSEGDIVTSPLTSTAQHYTTASLSLTRFLFGSTAPSSVAGSDVATTPRHARSRSGDETPRARHSKHEEHMRETARLLREELAREGFAVPEEGVFDSWPRAREPEGFSDEDDLLRRESIVTVEGPYAAEMRENMERRRRELEELALGRRERDDDEMSDSTLQPATTVLGALTPRRTESPAPPPAPISRTITPPPAAPTEPQQQTTLPSPPPVPHSPPTPPVEHTHSHSHDDEHTHAHDNDHSAPAHDVGFVSILPVDPPVLNPAMPTPPIGGDMPGLSAGVSPAAAAVLKGLGPVAFGGMVLPPKEDVKARQAELDAAAAETQDLAAAEPEKAQRKVLVEDAAEETEAEQVLFPAQEKKTELPVAFKDDETQTSDDDGEATPQRSRTPARREQQDEETQTEEKEEVKEEKKEEESKEEEKKTEETTTTNTAPAESTPSASTAFDPPIRPLGRTLTGMLGALKPAEPVKATPPPPPPPQIHTQADDEAEAEDELKAIFGKGKQRASTPPPPAQQQDQSLLMSPEVEVRAVSPTPEQWEEVEGILVGVPTDVEGFAHAAEEKKKEEEEEVEEKEEKKEEVVVVPVQTAPQRDASPSPPPPPPEVEKAPTPVPAAAAAAPAAEKPATPAPAPAPAVEKAATPAPVQEAVRVPSPAPAPAVVDEPISIPPGTGFQFPSAIDLPQTATHGDNILPRLPTPNVDKSAVDWDRLVDEIMQERDDSLVNVSSPITAVPQPAILHAPVASSLPLPVPAVADDARTPPTPNQAALQMMGHRVDYAADVPLPMTPQPVQPMQVATPPPPPPPPMAQVVPRNLSDEAAVPVPEIMVEQPILPPLDMSKLSPVYTPPAPAVSSPTTATTASVPAPAPAPASPVEEPPASPVRRVMARARSRSRSRSPSVSRSPSLVDITEEKETPLAPKVEAASYFPEPDMDAPLAPRGTVTSTAPSVRNLHDEIAAIEKHSETLEEPKDGEGGEWLPKFKPADGDDGASVSPPTKGKAADAMSITSTATGRPDMRKRLSRAFSFKDRKSVDLGARPTTSDSAAISIGSVDAPEPTPAAKPKMGRRGSMNTKDMVNLLTFRKDKKDDAATEGGEGDASPTKRMFGMGSRKKSEPTPAAGETAAAEGAPAAPPMKRRNTVSMSNAVNLMMLRRKTQEEKVHLAAERQQAAASSSAVHLAHGSSTDLPLDVPADAEAAKPVETPVEQAEPPKPKRRNTLTMGKAVDLMMLRKAKKDADAAEGATPAADASDSAIADDADAPAAEPPKERHHKRRNTLTMGTAVNLMMLRKPKDTTSTDDAASDSAAAAAAPPSPTKKDPSKRMSMAGMGNMFGRKKPSSRPGSAAGGATPTTPNPFTSNIDLLNPSARTDSLPPPASPSSAAPSPFAAADSPFARAATSDSIEPVSPSSSSSPPTRRPTLGTEKSASRRWSTAFTAATAASSAKEKERDVTVKRPGTSGSMSAFLALGGSSRKDKEKEDKGKGVERVNSEEGGVVRDSVEVSSVASVPVTAEEGEGKKRPKWAGRTKSLMAFSGKKK